LSKVYRVSIRQDVCIGCGLCRVYCQTEHSRSKDMIKAFKKEMPRPLPRIHVEAMGEISFAVQCRHCTDPWCVYACLTGAIRRDPATGSIAIAAEKCVGCWTCVLACPYGALTRDMSSSLVVKCDLCPDQDIPVCVANCPNEALVLSTNGEDGKVRSQS